MVSDIYLIDTHALLWFQENNAKMPDRALQTILNADNTILFSQISLYEIAIKQKIGKLPNFVASVEKVYLQAITDGFTFLNIQNTHIFNYDKVPFMEHHRDPFDRLLIATAIAENAIIISDDHKFSAYNDWVKIVW